MDIINNIQNAVVDIDLRYTMLDTEHETILVPNAFLFNYVVKVIKEIPEASIEVSP